MHWNTEIAIETQQNKAKNHPSESFLILNEVCLTKYSRWDNYYIQTHNKGIVYDITAFVIFPPNVFQLQGFFFSERNMKWEVVPKLQTVITVLWPAIPQGMAS